MSRGTIRRRARLGLACKGGCRSVRTIRSGGVPCALRHDALSVRNGDVRPHPFNTPNSAGVCADDHPDCLSLCPGRAGVRARAGSLPGGPLVWRQDPALLHRLRQAAAHLEGRQGPDRMEPVAHSAGRLRAHARRRRGGRDRPGRGAPRLQPAAAAQAFCRRHRRSGRQLPAGHRAVRGAGHGRSAGARAGAGHPACWHGRGICRHSGG